MARIRGVLKFIVQPYHKQRYPRLVETCDILIKERLKMLDIEIRYIKPPMWKDIPCKIFVIDIHGFPDAPVQFVQKKLLEIMDIMKARGFSISRREGVLYWPNHILPSVVLPMNKEDFLYDRS